MSKENLIKQIAIILFEKRDRAGSLGFRLCDIARLDLEDVTFSSFQQAYYMGSQNKYSWTKEWNQLTATQLACLWLIIKTDGLTVREKIAKAGFSSHNITRDFCESKKNLPKKTMALLEASGLFTHVEMNILNKANESSKKAVAKKRYEEIGLRDKLVYDSKKREEVKALKTEVKCKTNKIKTEVKVKPEPKTKRYGIIIDKKANVIVQVIKAVGDILKGNVEEL